MSSDTVGVKGDNVILDKLRRFYASDPKGRRFLPILNHLEYDNGKQTDLHPKRQKHNRTYHLLIYPYPLLIRMYNY